MVYVLLVEEDTDELHIWADICPIDIVNIQLRFLYTFFLSFASCITFYCFLAPSCH